jgi:hypothetical protein
MSFILVIVPRPDELTLSLNEAWAVFYTQAKVERLKAMAGVFYIDDTAWIFDTRKALREFALVTHRATEQGIQLHSFPLNRETLRSHVTSYPQSQKLEEFLAS